MKVNRREPKSVLGWKFMKGGHTANALFRSNKKYVCKYIKISNARIIFGLL
jgi:hypothetical protein